VRSVLLQVQTELAKARERFPPFNSPHEGAAVIREEFEELWDCVKADEGHSAAAYHEAIQLAAMAVRYASDLFGKVPT
jgi:hypothetical protein